MKKNEFLDDWHDDILRDQAESDLDEVIRDEIENFAIYRNATSDSYNITKDDIESYLNK